MQTKDKPDIFTLLAQWSELLPSKGEQNPNKIEKLNKLGGEIEQLCAEIENGTQPNTTLPLVKKETETDFKPSFIFQLTSDQTINSTRPKFNCVFDFCEKLSEYCETSITKQLNIETDWLKLLLACSSHNYDRFMWIHLTFQASNNLKLNWNQVRKRLMCKFDDPNRRTNVLNQIASFKYIPEVESIHTANKRFLRLTQEAEIDTVNFYIHGLPDSIKPVLTSTTDYDTTTNFHCNLKDVMQRATVFISATEDEFIFYSQTAHLAVSLEHQKVNQKDCEFHLLAEHSTSSCPDYTIVKYPYMEFTPLNLPVSFSLTCTPQTELIPIAPANDKLNNSNQLVIATPTKTIVEPVVIKKETPNGTENQSVKELARRVISESTIASKPQPKLPEEDVNGLTKLQVLDKASRLSLSGIPLPENLKARLEQLKEQAVESQASSSTNNTSREEPSYRIRTRSRSPECTYRDRSESPEIGCYIHGRNATHNTKDCRQAQMVIPARRSSRRSVSPVSISRKNRFGKTSSKENICIFCQLPFKRGHLSVCKEAPPKPRRK